MDLVLSKESIDNIISALDEDVLRAGADCVLLVDRSGNLIVNRGDPAKLIGEDDFALLFHKGKNENIHFTKVGKGFILITLFGKDVSLGLIRLNTARVTDTLVPILGGEL
jgi:hypothetical protein